MYDVQESHIANIDIGRKEDREIAAMIAPIQNKAEFKVKMFDWLKNNLHGLQNYRMQIVTEIQEEKDK